MAGPKLADYLEIRERELESQISNVRGHLVPLEAELAQVRKIRSLIRDARAAGLTDLASDAALPDPPTQSPLEQVVQAVQPAVSQLLNAASAETQTVTIKQMILCALRDHFGDAGATPSELSAYMRDAFGKEIDRNSISPQLSRLRDEGMVDMRSNGKWTLSSQGMGIMRYGRTDYVSPLQVFLDQSGSSLEPTSCLRNLEQPVRDGDGEPVDDDRPPPEDTEPKRGGLLRRRSRLHDLK